VCTVEQVPDLAFAGNTTADWITFGYSLTATSGHSVSATFGHSLNATFGSSLTAICHAIYHATCSNGQVCTLEQVPELAFTGDTTADWITHPDNADVLKAKVLIMEVRILAYLTL
jgi:hypothetical protein